MLNLTGVLAKTISVAALSLFVVSLALAVPADKPAGKLTVGDFLVLYAASIHVTPPDATAATALAALKAAKALPSGPLILDAPLTHGIVVRIGKAAGMKISTKTPDREFGRAEAQLFLQNFGSLLAPHDAPGSSSIYAASDNPPGDPSNHANTEKGRKKGRPFSSATEPE